MMNESRFTALAEQYMDMVYRIALNASGSAADAEDEPVRRPQRQRKNPNARLSRRQKHGRWRGHLRPRPVPPERQQDVSGAAGSDR